MQSLLKPFQSPFKVDIGQYGLHTTLKIIAVRDPLSRLHSAWKDKSRTFRFQNGSIDWEQIKNESTWTWGITNDIRAENVMKDTLLKHDYNFNPRRFGIDKFEDLVVIEFSCIYSNV